MAIAALACFAERQYPPAAEMPDTAIHPSEAGAPPPLWTPVARPLAIYGMDAPQLQSLPFAFTARRDAAGAREDTLAFGAFDQPAAPHLRVMLLRSPYPEAFDASLFLDLARQAARAGLAVMRSTPAEGLATKFGVAEVAEAALSDGSEERACLAFRFGHPDVGFRAAGWLCPISTQALDRQALACALDRLSLIEAGNDEALKGVFGQAERQRLVGCAAAPSADTVGPTIGERRPASRSPPRRAGRTPPVSSHKGSAALPSEPRPIAPQDWGEERGRQAEAEPLTTAARLLWSARQS